MLYLRLIDTNSKKSTWYAYDGKLRQIATIESYIEYSIIFFNHDDTNKRIDVGSIEAVIQYLEESFPL